MVFITINNKIRIECVSIKSVLLISPVLNHWESIKSPCVFILKYIISVKSFIAIARLISNIKTAVQLFFYYYLNIIVNARKLNLIKFPSELRDY